MAAPARLSRSARAASRWFATCAAGVLVLGLVAPSVASAQEEPAADAVATQASPDTASAAALPDTLAVDGHGWGHGRGMGQYGSLGYATGWSGGPWTHTTILDHFYGGTTVGHIADPLMMVLLKARPAGSAMVVYRAAGLQVTGQPDTPPAVRVTPRADGKFDLQTSTVCGGPWSTPARVIDGPVRVVPMADSGTTALRLCNSDGSAIAYHHTTELIAHLDRTYNLVRMEEMLRGIVPRESPASWGDAADGKGMAALRSQAVAARSYAAAGDTRWGSPHLAVGADATTCDDTFCQVYGGIARITPTGAVETRTHANTDTAIADTRNEVRRSSSGGVARTEFSSSTGGYTAGGTFPAVVDEGDAVSSNPNHQWATSLARSAVETRYGLGTLTDVQFTKRNGLGSMGGRAVEVRLVGTEKSVDVTGNQFRQAFSLRSDWFDVTVPPPPAREPRTIDTACPSGSVPSGAFTDIDPASPHARAIDCVAWRNIAEGTGDGRFSPALDVTRGQMASFVARMVTAGGGSLPSSPPDAFDDDDGSTHETATNQLAELGIVRGVTEGSYRPKAPIDRAQLASILARALTNLDVPLSSSPPGAFGDDNDSVHETAIDQLAEEGVVAGTSPGVYQPKATARRDQMASFVARSLDLALST